MITAIQTELRSMRFDLSSLELTLLLQLEFPSLGYSPPWSLQANHLIQQCPCLSKLH
jgi:hypothetical protein